MTTTRSATASPYGLTEAAAAAARARGESNKETTRSSRSYRRILLANVFTLFNNLLFAIGVTLLVLGRTNDAIVSVGLGLVNSLISSLQEMRAKRKLDALRLLHRSYSRVIRDGVEREVAPTELVRGDLVRLVAGDQIVVDGTLVSAGRLEVDESLLTGEADPVCKQDGDTLLSGSSCLSGEGLQRAESVGAASYANTVTAVARQWTAQRTPLQVRIDIIVRLMMVVVALMSGAILAQAALRDLPLVRVVQTAAVLSGLIPYGLFFLITVSYAAGAATITRRGALIQQINAVESLSNVDVLCTDKTGTLTSGRLRLEDVRALAGADPTQVRTLLGSMARSAAAGNLTTAALAAQLPGDRYPVEAEVPFDSSRGWSAVGFPTPSSVGSPADRPAGRYLLGSLDALAVELAVGADELARQVAELASNGLRVLVFATSVDPHAELYDDAGAPCVPPLRAVALVVLSDELRPHVCETVRDLHERGIAIKVVSGDDPRTVAAVAHRAGLHDQTPISGSDLAGMTPAAFAEAVAQRTVFGRITPKQKEHIVDALRQRGQYTAMIGDGVNDIPALKRAQVGIAMESGSGVARNVAEIVLLKDSFAALVPAQREGQRIIAGISTSLYLYLARVVTSILIIVAVAILGLGFPYEPAQVSLVLFTVGVPTMVLTAWARPEPIKSGLFGSLARFVAPVSIVTAIFGGVLYLALYEGTQRGLLENRVPDKFVERFELFTGIAATEAEFTDRAATILAQTGLTTFTSITAFVLILFLEPPWRIFTGWAPLRADKRPALLAAGLFVVLAVILATPPLAQYFYLLPSVGLGGVLIIVIPPWFLTLRAVWRHDLLERILGLPGGAGRSESSDRSD